MVALCGVNRTYIDGFPIAFMPLLECCPFDMPVDYVLVGEEALEEEALVGTLDAAASKFKLKRKQLRGMQEDVKVCDL